MRANSRRSIVPYRGVVCAHTNVLLRCAGREKCGCPSASRFWPTRSSFLIRLDASRPAHPPVPKLAETTRESRENTRPRTPDLLRYRRFTSTPNPPRLRLDQDSGKYAVDMFRRRMKNLRSETLNESLITVW